MQPEDVTDVALGSAIRALYAASSGELDATDEEMRTAQEAAK